MQPLESLRRITGHRLRLRLVSTKDAAYIHGLRTNPSYNRHLSAVTGTADDQRRWIERYKTREAAMSELYYVIEGLNGTACGVVRLYEIEEDRFTWGSWILDNNKPAKAALESALLSFGVGFEGLDRPRAVFDARLGNDHAIAFYRRLGAAETGRDEINVYFEYTRDRFLRDRQQHCRTIREGISEA